MNKALNDIVRRADAWPDSAQEELAQLAREIEAELKAAPIAPLLRSLSVSTGGWATRPPAVGDRG